jgi:biotin carboxyl carrier protein
MSSTYKVHLSENQAHEVSLTDDGRFILDGEAIDLDAVKTGPDTWNVLRNNKSYNIRVLSFDAASKKLSLKVNNEVFDLRLTTGLDELLSRMGMDAASSSRMVDVRAPMPGLVLKVIVEEGAEISEGDHLIILEAMKMENVIKATGRGVVGKILVSNQDAVEKNQVLIEMQ